MTVGDLAGAVKYFEKKIQHLETLDERLKQYVNDKTRQATKAVLAEDIKRTADHLDKIFQEAHYLLLQYQREIARTKKWLLTLVFVSVLLGSIGSGLILYYVHPGKNEL